MAFAHASFDTYTALRDMDISDPLLGSWRLGQMASWSRWGTSTGDLAPITAHSQEDFDQLQPFTTRVILFAINLGGTAIADGLEDWRNFHTEGHGPDGTLRSSVAMAIEKTSDGDQVPALYMTDVFKLIPTKDAGLLNKQIASDLDKGIDHVERCAAILREELKICVEGAGGQIPALVAMGDKAFNWLTGVEQDQRIAAVVDDVLGDGASKRVHKMHHYSFGVGSNEKRAAALHRILECVIQGDPTPLEPAALK